MASSVAKVSWEKVAKKFSDPAVLRSLNHIRAKANEVNGVIVKESKPMAPIDFAAYKKKLNFTGAGVDLLEPMMKNTKIPQYTAQISSFEKQQREELMKVLGEATAAAQTDLEELYKARDDFEVNVRVNKMTSMADIRKRFPDIARSNEDEINQGLWFYNKEVSKQARLDAIEDTDDAHCRGDGSPHDGPHGFQFKTNKIPVVEGEDSYVAKNTKHYYSLGE
mmetsp:Transcript_108241/g.233212  ORF Transcript_108241/g.233212 Transcript_108241/m.233212 type:complete len:222 (-) Transcript_108241:113-778(-)